MNEEVLSQKYIAIVVQNKLLIKVILAHLKDFRIKYIDEIQVIKIFYNTDLDKQMVINYLHYYNSKNDIEIIENINVNPDFVDLKKLRRTSMISAPYHTLNWNIKKVGSNWRKSSNLSFGENIKIAIIDSGIDSTHPDLENNILKPGKSFIVGSDPYFDLLGHGTMVAGVISAYGKINGVGPNIKISSYKVFANEKADSLSVIEAIVQAVNDDMDIINLSLNTWKHTNEKGLIEAYQRAFQYATDNDKIIVASAGNERKSIEDSGDMINLPGGQKNIITVAATTRYDTPSSYSNFGSNVIISAPGGDISSSTTSLAESILTTFPTIYEDISIKMGLNKGYIFMVGTSLATAHVSAILGILKSYILKNNYIHDRISETLIEALLSGVSPIKGTNNRKYYGLGIVNLDKSLYNLKRSFM